MILTENSVFVRPVRIGFIAAARLVANEDDVNGYDDGLCVAFDAAAITPIAEAGWAVDQKRLFWLIVHWCGGNKKSFTCQFRSKYRRTRREVFPVLRRIQNIRHETGENGRTSIWHRANHRTPWGPDCLPASRFSLATPESR